MTTGAAAPAPAHRTLAVQSTRTMIERIGGRLALKAKGVIGDTASGTADTKHPA
jgi:hypothetical protein